MAKNHHLYREVITAFTQWLYTSTIHILHRLVGKLLVLVKVLINQTKFTTMLCSIYCRLQPHCHTVLPWAQCNDNNPLYQEPNGQDDYTTAL